MVSETGSPVSEKRHSPCPQRCPLQAGGGRRRSQSRPWKPSAHWQLAPERPGRHSQVTPISPLCLQAPWAHTLQEWHPGRKPSVWDRRARGLEPTCNRTWDGWLCWDETDAGFTTKQHCPDYYGDFDTK
ncbi:hypothetical protein CRUP_004740, partial [Coryphaenoides rupestris]